MNHPHIPTKAAYSMKRSIVLAVERKANGGTTLTKSVAFRERLLIVVRKIGGTTMAAAVAGCTVDTIRNWLKGRSEPSFRDIAQLSLASHKSLDWLAFGWIAK